MSRLSDNFSSNSVMPLPLASPVSSSPTALHKPSYRGGDSVRLQIAALVPDTAGLLVWLLAALCFVASAHAADEKITYDDHLAPIFRQRCGSCHGPTSRKADLDVTNYLSLMQGGASGTVIEPGDASASYLYSLVTHEAEPYMPQNADKIPDAEIDLLQRWIDGGALENKGSKAPKPKAKMAVAVELDPGKRPEVAPMPPRMVLEPSCQLTRPPMARSLASSPWAPLVAVASQRQVLLYNTSTLELVGVFPFPEGQPNVVRFSRDGSLLIAGGGQPALSGKVVVWDVATGERVVEVGNELDAVLAADISADHKRIALGGPQRVVRVYSTETGELLYEKAKHTDWVLAVEFSPDGVLLATADRNGGLCVWETLTGNEYLTLNGHTAAITGLSWRIDSNVLASGSEDGTVRLWEMENGTQIKNWKAKTAVLSLDFSRDGRLLTCGRDQIMRLWDQQGKQLLESPRMGDIAVSTTFCDESSRAIAASWAGDVQVYKADDAKLLGNLATNPPLLAERLAAAEQRFSEKTQQGKPLIEAVQKAQADFEATQSALAAAQKDVESKNSALNQLTAKANELDKQRVAQDSQRADIATKISQLADAQPLVAEALRHLTEALGKQPDDAKLVEVQGDLTQQLKRMASEATKLQKNHDEIAAAISAADTTFKELDAKLQSAKSAAASATEQVQSREADSQKLAAVLETARQAAQPIQTELAQAEKDVARWRDEIAFRDQMAQLRKELNASQQVVAQRQAEVDKAAEQLAAAKTAVDAAKTQLDEATQNASAVAEKIEAARSPK